GNLRPFRIKVAPKSGAPGGVEFFECDIAVPQPVLKTRLAIRAITASIQFIINLPANHRWMSHIMFCQRKRDVATALSLTGMSRTKLTAVTVRQAKTMLIDLI